MGELGSHRGGCRYGGDASRAAAETFSATSNGVIMAFLVLGAKGWTATSSVGTIGKREFLLAAGLCGGVIGLYLLERVVRDMDTKYCYGSDVGGLILLIRASVCVYYLTNVRQTLTSEDQVTVCLLERRLQLTMLRAGAPHRVFEEIRCCRASLVPCTTICVSRSWWQLQVITDSARRYIVSRLCESYLQMRIVLVIGAIVHLGTLAILCYLVWPKNGDDYVTLRPDDILAGDTP